NIPKAEQGVIDLRNSDLDRTMKLNGEWLFYWNQFLEPEESSPSAVPMTVPSFWNSPSSRKLGFPREGYATYRLKILLPPDKEALALDVRYLFTSYRLFIDGQLYDSSGIPGTNAEETEPYFQSKMVSFVPENSEVNLTLHVANFDLNKGGIWGDLILGTPEAVSQRRELRMFREIFLCGVIFFTAFYHLGLFLFRKEDKPALFFGLCCFFIALRTLATGDIYLVRMLPSLSWSGLLKVEYICYYLAVPSFLYYLEALYPADSNKKLIRGVTLLYLLSSLFTGLFSPRIFNGLLSFVQLLTACSCLYITFVLAKAVAKHRSNSSLLLVGFLTIFLFFLNDVLHSLDIIHTALLLPVGLFFFTISQSILIQKTSRDLFIMVENQKNELVTSHDLFEKSRLGTILGLAKLAEYRDEDTGLHLERIREYCRILAVGLSKREEFGDYITDRYINDLYQSSILHDIGKVGVPDSILLKKGKLTPREFEIIKLHTKWGGEALENIESTIKMESFLTLGKEIAWFHHEKWDGSGYPKGLAGKKIPLSARITALADVYDALTSERPYKKAFSHGYTSQKIIEGRGKHFDPVIVDVFIENADLFNEIRRDFELKIKKEQITIP
ncbi:MAG: 7TM diverse intracellular signaling domain-containing protein, partial [Spirochaetales bacterium]|nr:7TM diverse intracellular signaling domain-containing protein [Spirochaetales bacterium]